MDGPECLTLSSVYSPLPSSGIVWELKPKQRWKPFNQKQIGLLESAYQKHLSAGATEASGWVKIENNFEVCWNHKTRGQITPTEMKEGGKTQTKRILKFTGKF